MSKYIQADGKVIIPQTHLTREQKKAVGLLSIGTFLEYFDLMLYVHMAVLLNELFFPAADSHTTAIYSALAFCSTYVLRPVGALIFGWIGDNIGRKATIVITTSMMAISCIIMANLPTYSQIGITATWIVTICRIVQGMSSMAEVIGAEVYLTETIKPPARYPAVALICFFATLGSVFSLAIASLVTSFGLSWRSAFWIGSAIAIIGAMARTTLRETPEFANAKRQIKNILKKVDLDSKTLANNYIYQETVSIKTSIALVLIHFGRATCFYISYIYFGNILKISCNYTSVQVIHQNFIVSIAEMFGMFGLVYLSYKIYPLTILKVKLIIILIFTLFSPYLLNNANTPFKILLIQSFIMFFTLETVPAAPILYKHFPIFKRFTYTTFLYAVSRTFIYIITSFGLIYLTEYFSHWGILMMMIPVIIGYTFGLYHFEKLEKKAQYYPN